MGYGLWAIVGIILFGGAKIVKHFFFFFLFFFFFSFSATMGEEASMRLTY